jgi:hypothetical protein
VVAVAVTNLARVPRVVVVVVLKVLTQKKARAQQTKVLLAVIIDQ